MYRLEPGGSEYALSQICTVCTIVYVFVGGPHSVYCLKPGGSEHSAVTNIYSLYHYIFIGGPH